MKDTVLTLLQSTDGNYLSGERMSQVLGISRAAVWKQVKKLRSQGYEIEAVTNLGYRLVSEPETLDRDKIHTYLEDHPWRDLVTVLDTVDSTNNLAKRMGAEGAPHGSVFLADAQSGGRGRLGRGFVSPKGVGIYLSVLLRPELAPTELSHITAMAAVATCDAVETACGIRPGIKWTNDLLLDEKKLTGILTESSIEWESNSVEYVVIGIGINCNHQETDFPEDIRHKATSLRLHLGHSVDRNRLAAELIRTLHRLSLGIVSEKRQWIARYAENCVTIGRQVKVIRPTWTRLATATGIDENGALLVRYDNDETGVVFSGEVSIRGVDGYI